MWLIMDTDGNMTVRLALLSRSIIKLNMISP